MFLDQQTQLFHIKKTVRLLSKNDVKREYKCMNRVAGECLEMHEFISID